MEEFRPVVADSVVLTLLNKHWLAPDNFARVPGGRGCALDRDGWRVVAQQYTRRLQTLVTPPGQQRRISYRKLLELQARKLRRVITGEEGEYMPFLAK